MEKLGLNLINAVGKGADQSVNPPILLNLTYYGNPSNKSDIVAFIGKGVIFDTGGYNIKMTGMMETMFADMEGSASCLGAFIGAVELGNFL